MQSYIITSTNDAQTDAYIASVIKKENISPFDTLTVGQIIEGEKTHAIGIETIRDVQKSLYLTPVQGTKKIICIRNADTLTQDGQNALLKTLEEPPAHALLYLIAQNSNALLPTILSRCTIVALQPTVEKQTDNKDMRELFLSLPTLSIDESLEIAQNAGKTKEDAKQFTKNLLLAGRDALVQDAQTTGTLLPALHMLQKAHEQLTTTNLHQRFVLENFFLQVKIA